MITFHFLFIWEFREGSCGSLERSYFTLTYSTWKKQENVSLKDFNNWIGQDFKHFVKICENETKKNVSTKDTTKSIFVLELDAF